MNKFLVIFCAMLLSVCLGQRTFAQQQPNTKSFSVTVGFGRAAPITDWRVSPPEFSFAATLNYKISKRFSTNASVVKTLTFAPVIFRLGVSYRLFSF